MDARARDRAELWRSGVLWKPTADGVMTAAAAHAAIVAAFIVQGVA